MKQINYIKLVVAITASSMAHADLSQGRTPERIDFTKMIEQNNRDIKQLKRDAPAREQQAEAVVANQDKERKNVVDFIDMEVGFEEEKHEPVVDRRFDSVGAARPVTDFKLELRAHN